MTARTITPAGGSFFLVLRVKNTGSRPCVTAGYPGVAVTNASQQQVFQAARVTSRYTAITLARGQTASAVLTGSEHRADGSSCPRITSLLVTPPDTRSVRLRATTYGCVRPGVKPLTRGTDGDLGG